MYKSNIYTWFSQASKYVQVNPPLCVKEKQHFVTRKSVATTLKKKYDVQKCAKLWKIALSRKDTHARGHESPGIFSGEHTFELFALLRSAFYGLLVIHVWRTTHHTLDAHKYHYLQQAA